MNILKSLQKAIDPKIGKTVIHFTTHGCMGQIHEFDFIGKIVDVDFIQNYGSHGPKKFYKVEVLKSPKGEKRDGVTESKLVPSWYLQNLGGDFYIAYD